MKNVVSFLIGNAKSDIITKNNSCEIHTLGTHNANVIFCAHNYANVGDVVTMEVAKRGTKAADTFYAAIANLEKTFKVKADFINGTYVAVLLAINLKVCK